MKEKEIKAIAADVTSDNRQVYRDERVVRAKPGAGFVVPDRVEQESPIAFSRQIEGMQAVQAIPMKEPVKRVPVEATVIPSRSMVLNRPQTDAASRVPVEAKPIQMYQADGERSDMNALDKETAKRQPVADKVAVPVHESVVSGHNLINPMNLDKALSTTCNKMEEDMHINDFFTTLRAHLRDKKMHAKTFYGKIQNAGYYAAFTLGGFTRDGDNNPVIPNLEGNKFMPMLVFFDRLHNDTRISLIGTDKDKEKRDATKIMPEYRRLFNDSDGFPVEWLEIFKNRLKEKLVIDPSGLNAIVDYISSVWVAKATPSIAEETTVVQVQETKEPVVATPINKAPETSVLNNPVAPVVDDQTGCIGDCDRCKLNECVSQPDATYDGGDDDDDDEEEDVFIINTHNIDGYDCIMIQPDSEIMIPIYYEGSIDDIPLDQCTLPSMGDNRNNIWDMLIHFAPKYIFTAEDPTEYITDLFDAEITDVKVVILGNLESGLYVMGAYGVDPDFGRVDTQERYDYMRRLNYLVQEHIADTAISHLKRSLSNPENFMTEDDAIEKGDEDYNSDQEASDDDQDDVQRERDFSEGIEDPEEEGFVMTKTLAAAITPENDELASAAMAAITGGRTVQEEPDHLSSEVPIDTNSVPFQKTEPEYPKDHYQYEDPDDTGRPKGPQRNNRGGMNDDGTFVPRGKKDKRRDRDRDRDRGYDRD